MARQRNRRRRAENWIAGILGGALLLYLAFPYLQRAVRAAPKRRVLVVYGFSILEEAMNGGVFPAFSRAWKERTGEEVFFPSSFAGSGTITNQILLGAPAAVALLANEGDAERLKKAGEIRTDWREFPARGVLNRTPFVILVRTGNPRGIRSFDDLARKDLQIIHPDPLTSGGAAWAILAEFVSATRGPWPWSSEDLGRGTAQLRGIWSRVVGQSPSAMGARTQFANGFGDALVTYEQQGIATRTGAGGDAGNVEMVLPPRTILSEHLAVLVDHNITARERFLALSFLDFLFSPRAQAIFVKYGFRSAVDPSLDAANASLAPLSDAVTVEEMGGWDAASGLVVERIWKGDVLKELGE
jgi:sulfate/thiosulfate transport system substrate-binding protein